jgi:hypothetical protein
MSIDTPWLMRDPHPSRQIGSSGVMQTFDTPARQPKAAMLDMLRYIY